MWTSPGGREEQPGQAVAASALQHRTGGSALPGSRAALTNLEGREVRYDVSMAAQ
jgi:hypothetical protein